NRAAGRGGAVYSDGAGASLAHCALAGNTAAAGGGIFVADAGGLRVMGAILWANTDASGGGESAQLTAAAGTPQVNFSAVQGWTGGLGGIGNIVESAAGPFVDGPGPDHIWGTADDNLHL